jgi:hypothetical protein
MEVTNPVEEFTEAIAELLLLQVPNGVAFARALVEPRQIFVFPVMAGVVEG